MLRRTIAAAAAGRNGRTGRLLERLSSEFCRTFAAAGLLGGRRRFGGGAPESFQTQLASLFLLLFEGGKEMEKKTQFECGRVRQ